LLDRLEQIEALRWIRLLYLYPTSVSASLIAAMRDSRKVVPYVDMPLQHAHPAVLKAMHRPPQPQRYLELFAQLRTALPQATIRSTFIIGFPGETNEHFEQLLDFLERARLDRVGFFSYSREEGTPAHGLPNQVPARVRNARLRIARDRQRAIAHANDRMRVGEELDVLVEGTRFISSSSPGARVLGTNRVSLGRSVREAPEVDGKVYLSGEHAAGSFVRATIVGYTEFDRLAAPIALP
jgi:ribosomal protein S12 methylthiotransferase